MKNNIAIIGVGSNINPEQNIQKAKEAIRKICLLISASEFVRTKPLLYPNQPDFLNGAFLVRSDDDVDTLKSRLKAIEIQLGRVKTKNKNGPRTIDLDILIYNGVVMDDDIYKRDFLKNAVLELLPNMNFSD